MVKVYCDECDISLTVNKDGDPVNCPDCGEIMMPE